MISGKTVQYYSIASSLLYVVALMILYVFRRKISLSPSDAGLCHSSRGKCSGQLHGLAATTQDSLPLKGWCAPATPKPHTLVFFHGNGDSLRTGPLFHGLIFMRVTVFWPPNIAAIAACRVAPEKRGFMPMRRAYINKPVRIRRGTGHIILFGHSLGAGVATQMATEFPVGGVILMPPYPSVVKMAQSGFQFFQPV